MLRRKDEMDESVPEYLFDEHEEGLELYGMSVTDGDDLLPPVLVFRGALDDGTQVAVMAIDLEEAWELASAIAEALGVQLLSVFPHQGGNDD